MDEGGRVGKAAQRAMERRRERLHAVEMVRLRAARGWHFRAHVPRGEDGRELPGVGLAELLRLLELFSKLRHLALIARAVGLQQDRVGAALELDAAAVTKRHPREPTAFE